MKSKAEKLLARSLCDAVADIPVGERLDASRLQADIGIGLQVWVPEVPGWEEESVDGFRFSEARMTADLEAELIGLGLLISDQTWTPAALRAAGFTDPRLALGLCMRARCAWWGTAGVVRMPHGSRDAERVLLRPVAELRAIPWVCVARSS